MKKLFALCICGLVLATGCAKKQEPAATDSTQMAVPEHGKGNPPPMNVTIPPNGQTVASQDIGVHLQTIQPWENVTISPPSVDNVSSLDSAHPNAVLSATVTYQLKNTTSQEIVVVLDPAEPMGDSLSKH